MQRWTIYPNEFKMAIGRGKGPIRNFEIKILNDIKTIFTNFWRLGLVASDGSVDILQQFSLQKVFLLQKH